MGLALALAVVTFAYILGSIPSGLLIGRYGWGTDPRKRGSGNIGFTNVWRTIGLFPACLVLAADAGKGGLAVLTAGALFPGAPTALRLGISGDLADSAVVAAAALVALLGNNFSVFMGFGGGKGIGTATGIILALAPQIAAALFVIWLAIVLATRYVSLASLVIAVLFPILVYVWQPGNYAYLAFAVAAAMVVIVRHRSNLGRLIAGTELKISGREPGNDL